ncbi:MAG: hypothetical protein LBL39_07360 [Planctomycetaceae bacterium]|jgi:hypothetical protein|nr:hypothetical protein [Planctomycetaceae bacterium]
MKDEANKMMKIEPRDIFCWRRFRIRWCKIVRVVESAGVGGFVMLLTILTVTFCFGIFGCSSARSLGIGNLEIKNGTTIGNPIFIPSCDHEFLWEVLADAFNSHFETVPSGEMPIRLYDNVLTEGRLDGKPKIGASLFEPWHSDSVGFGERFDCTLQTFRRRAILRVIPQVGGYQIEAFVYKELEDNPRPLRSPVSTANIRFKDDVDVFEGRIEVDQGAAGWIMIGRDTTMEQRLLREILYRLEHPKEIIRKSKTPIRG